MWIWSQRHDGICMGTKLQVHVWGKWIMNKACKDFQWKPIPSYISFHQTTCMMHERDHFIAQTTLDSEVIVNMIHLGILFTQSFCLEIMYALSRKLYAFTTSWNSLVMQRIPLMWLTTRYWCNTCRLWNIQVNIAHNVNHIIPGMSWWTHM